MEETIQTVPPTGTSNTTPQEMVYGECVPLGGRMGIFFLMWRESTLGFVITRGRRRGEGRGGGWFLK